MEPEFYVQWHITNQCNLRCRHCYQDEFTNQRDLDAAGLRTISANLLRTIESWNKTACIHLTGGEPLLRPDLFPLLENLNRSLSVEELGLITNGLLLDRTMIERLSAYSKLSKIKMSLDGADRATNDAIRGKGNFEGTIDRLRLVRQGGRFEVILMFTIMKNNFRSLPDFIRLCQDLKIDGLILERFVPLGRGRGFSDQVLSKREWKEFVETLSEFFSVDPDEPMLLPYQAFQITFDEEEPELSGAPCVIGSDGLCVMPDGEVFPCRRFPVSIGNLSRDSLKTIWEESEILRRLRNRKNLKGRCGKCGVEDCRGCRSLALSLTGDDLAEDPHCSYEGEINVSVRGGDCA
jgi:radical SAM protein with 4Fe4S-binding SPASM domain